MLGLPKSLKHAFEPSLFEPKSPLQGNGIFKPETNGPKRRRSSRRGDRRFYSADKYWIEHLDIPLSYVRNYISQVKKGVKIERPTAEVAAERERITQEYAEL